MAENRPLGVVIAARNASATLAQCLSAVCGQADDFTEIIVVDDFSTDDTADMAQTYPVRVIRFSEHRGVAAARNAGVAASSAPIIFFLDADVVAAPNALAIGRDIMKDPSLDAVFGSYDESPACESMVSLFKNLSHHYLHQQCAGAAVTFWSGCGLVRRDAFLAVGGFDEQRFRVPAGEDIEFGMRLADHGANIRLEPELQAKHLKRWTLKSMLVTDIAHRAIPWTQFCMERGRFPSVLNLSLRQRAAALTTVALVVALALAPVTGIAGIGWLLIAALIVAAIGVNRGLYAFFYRRRGLRLAAIGFLLQQLYYAYALLGFAAGLVFYIRRRRELRRSSTELGDPFGRPGIDVGRVDTG